MKKKKAEKLEENRQKNHRSKETKKLEKTKSRNKKN
jgi:hypothetical protein